MPNLGRPTQQVDGFGNVTQSSHTPSTGGFTNQGQYVAPEASTGQQITTDVNGNPASGIGTQLSTQQQVPANGVAQNSAAPVMGITPASELAQGYGEALVGANTFRNDAINQGYNQANAQYTPYMGAAQNAYGQYSQAIQGPTNTYNPNGLQQAMYMDALTNSAQQNPNLAGYATNNAGMANLNQASQQAGQMPSSQYFNQAAQNASYQMPRNLQDIEGYDLMTQARDEALRQSGQGFAQGGKFFSGSRMAEAGNIGANAAQNLINQSRQNQQQSFQNQMGLGQTDVALQQQQMNNLLGTSQAQQSANQNQFNMGMAVDQYGNQVRQQRTNNLGQVLDFNRGVDETNYAREQQRLAQLGQLGQAGIGMAQQMGNNQIAQGVQVGNNQYGAQSDIAKLAMGANAQDTNTNLAERGLLNQQQGNQNSFWGDILGAGATIAPYVIPMMCDIRLKENIKLVDKIGPYNWYEFNYIGNKNKVRGPMAQEVQKIKPEAVFEVDGYLAVDLGAM